MAQIDPDAAESRPCAERWREAGVGSSLWYSVRAVMGLSQLERAVLTDQYSSP